MPRIPHQAATYGIKRDHSDRDERTHYQIVRVDDDLDRDDEDESGKAVGPDLLQDFGVWARDADSAKGEDLEGDTSGREPPEKGDDYFPVRERDEAVSAAENQNDAPGPEQRLHGRDGTQHVKPVYCCECRTKYA